MPYIQQKQRIKLIPDDTKVATEVGELNFMLTTMCQQYFIARGGRYQQINDIIGALECCKLEFYRRLVAPYEDKAIERNGDVYE